MREKIINIGSFGSYDAVAYKEREGVIVDEYDSGGTKLYTDIYKIKNNQAYVIDSFEIKYNDEKTAYFINNKETDKSKYLEELDRYRDNLTWVGPNVEAEDE